MLNSNRWRWGVCFVMCGVLLGSDPVRAETPVPAAKLIAHWPLREDARDVVGAAHGSPENLAFDGGAAVFNGRNSRIRIESTDALNLGTKDFSLALWIRCQTPMTSTLGDLVNKFDSKARRGFNLHVAGSSPAYNAMSDTRHIHFGIDDGYVSDWEDHGKPWSSNSLITNLVTFEGALYCGIADADRPQDRARVFRYSSDKQWVDCGRLGEDANHHSVMSMLVHQGKLYAGTGIWDWVQALGGLKDAPPPAPTRVFVYEGGHTLEGSGTSRQWFASSLSGQLQRRTVCRHRQSRKWSCLQVRRSDLDRLRFARWQEL